MAGRQADSRPDEGHRDVPFFGFRILAGLWKAEQKTQRLKSKYAKRDSYRMEVGYLTRTQ
jgi:hypothetical protein